MDMWAENTRQLRHSREASRLEKGMVDKAIKKLVKSDFIMFHPTSYGHQYSLNPNRLKEIEDIIESQF